MALHVLIGAAIGAVLGAGTSAVTSLIRGKPLDWKSIGAAALGGAAAGAITSLTFGAGALAGTGLAKVGGMTLAGAAGGFTESVSDNVFHERKWTEGVVKSTAEGAAIGAAAGVIRVAAKPVASFLSRNPAIKRFVSKRAAKELAKPLRRLWERYRDAMLKKPRATQAWTGGALAAAGDLISQAGDGQPGVDLKRTAYRSLWAAGFGATAGWSWLNKLERLFPGRSWASTIKKTIADQLLMVPASTLPHLTGYHMVVEGKSPGRALDRALETTPKTWAMSLQVWPAFTAARFKWVPFELQPTVSRLMGMVWNVMFARTAFAPDEDEDEGAGRTVTVDRRLGEDGDEAEDAEDAPIASEEPLDRGGEVLLRASERGIERAAEGLIDVLAR